MHHQNMMGQDSEMIEYKYDPRTMTQPQYSGAEFQHIQQPLTRIREIKEEEVQPSTSSGIPYGPTETDYDAFFEDATTIMAIHAGETRHKPNLDDYFSGNNDADILDAFAAIKTSDGIRNSENHRLLGVGGIQATIKKEAQNYESLQTLEHYLKNRSVSPSAYFGARHIVVDDNEMEDRGPPNINIVGEIEPLKQLNPHENKKTFMTRMRRLVQATQLFPKKDDLQTAIIETQFDEDTEATPDWCHIHYYEFCDRVGEIFKAIHPIVVIDGLCAPSDSTRLCLGAVSNPSRDPVCVAARRQIGKGCKLIYENENVLIESNSDAAIFIQSPIHAKFRNDHLATVYRLPAGHRMEVFHNKLFTALLENAKATNDFNQVYYLQSMCHVRMSFVKGWGERYRRQHITSTPCWVELHLPIPLKAVDKTLKEVSGPTNEVHSDT